MRPEICSDKFKWFVKRKKAGDHQLEDLELTDTPGVWRVTKGCPGGKDCTHAFRGALGGCNGDVDLVIRFEEWGKRDDNGRFVSPYQEWYKQKQHADEAEGGDDA